MFQVAIVTFLVGSLLGRARRRTSSRADRVPRDPGPRRRRPDVAGAGHDRRHHPAARARSIPGLLRRGLRHLVACSARCSAASSPTAPAGSGSSSSTSRSASPRWSSPRAALKMPHVRREHTIDYLGAASIVASVTLVPALHRLGRPGPRLGLRQRHRAARRPGVVLAVAFVFVELRATEPIIPMRLFAQLDLLDRQRCSASSSASRCSASLIFMPVYLQVVDGMSPTQSGLAMLPMVVGIFSTSIAAGQIMIRTGRYKASRSWVRLLCRSAATESTPLPIRRRSRRMNTAATRIPPPAAIRASRRQPLAR